MTWTFINKRVFVDATHIGFNQVVVHVGENLSLVERGTKEEVFT